jgi:hypothetical protein
MEEKIELSAFLNQLIVIINKRLEFLEDEIRKLKKDMDLIIQNQTIDEEPVKNLESKIRNLESSVNSLRSKSQIDSSFLGILETEKLE